MHSYSEVSVQYLYKIPADNVKMLPPYILMPEGAISSDIGAVSKVVVKRRNRVVRSALEIGQVCVFNSRWQRGSATPKPTHMGINIFRKVRETGRTQRMSLTVQRREAFSLPRLIVVTGNSPRSASGKIKLAEGLVWMSFIQCHLGPKASHGPYVCVSRWSLNCLAIGVVLL